jgi:translation initiation factor IF-2
MAGKMRVGELAKDLGVAPKMIIEQLAHMGYQEKTSSSALDDTLIPVLREALSTKAAEFARREADRLEAERAAAIRAKVEAVKAAAAKEARRSKKAEGAKPRTAKTTTRAKTAPKTAERPGALKPKVAARSVPKPEEKIVKVGAGKPLEPLVPAAEELAAAAPAAATVAETSPAAVEVLVPSETPLAPSPATEQPAAVAPPPVPPTAPPPITRVAPVPAKRARVRETPPRPRKAEAARARRGVPEPEPAGEAVAATAPVEPRPKETAEPMPPAEPPRETAKPPTDGKVVPLRPTREETAAPAPAAAPPARVPAPAAAAPSAEPQPAVPPAREVLAEVPAAPAAVTAAPAPPAPKREVLRLLESVTVAELAEKMGKKGGEVIRELVGLGIMASINRVLDVEKAKAVAARFGFEVEARALESVEPVEEAVDPSQLRPRSPVVTVMGHVDHGKTSLLDAIRKTKVTEREFGGITQHIGAYQVETSHGKVTFLDTPGHEAFTAMRARGAQATDIVILVVAADDGVMPQTVEAINHAKAANVPIIVAVNKVDKADANPDRVKQELANLGLVPEEWGGQTIFVATSAKKATGIDSLLEMTALQAEIMELRANPSRAAKGVVVEAKLDRGRGPVATVLVQQGTLRESDVVVAGQHHGRIRAMFNDRRQRVKEAEPVDPVEVLGLSGVPSAGDTLVAVGDERKARQIVLSRQEQERKVASTVRVTLADLHKQIEAGEVKELRVILKGDVHGSLEALQDALERLSTDEVKIRVIHGAVGTITETDVMLASASNAIVIGFNVRAEPKAVQQAQAEQVDIKAYNVIYEAIDDVRAALEGMLAPLIREVPLGRAQVRALFPIKNVGTIAGSFVLEGKITRTGKVRVLRGVQVVGEGQIASLKRFKDDAREVLQGLECGIGVSGVADVQVGDVIEVYTTEEVARTL